MNFDPLVFVQVLIALMLGLMPAVWLWSRNRTLQDVIKEAQRRADAIEKRAGALEQQADEVFFSNLHIDRLVYTSTEGVFFKDHYVNFEERLFYKNFPLTDRQQRRLLLQQNFDSSSIVPLIQAASEIVALPVPLKVTTRSFAVLQARLLVDMSKT